MISSDLSQHIEPVARLVLGEPNSRLSSKNEIRFGTNGSLSVDRDKGVWYDHESNVGGGVLDLLRHKRGMTNGAALRWLREHNFEADEPANDRRGSERSQQRRVLKEYDYWDEVGNLAFQTLRYEPKDFRQRHPDPAAPGGWVWNLQGVRLVLYRLPQVVEAVTAGRTIYICEGEKDADALAGLDVAATCNPMGAKKWNASYSEFLRGADVVILPHNDEAGREHRDQVMAALQGVAARIRVVEAPDVGYKGDVHDWIEAGGDAQQLAALVAAAPDLSRPARAADPPRPKTDQQAPEPLPLFPPLPPAAPYPVEALGPVLEAVMN